MKYKYYSAAFIIMVALSVILSHYDRVGEDNEDTVIRAGSGYSSDVSAMHNTDASIMNIKYRRNGIEAEYPQIISGGSEDERKKWNQIINDDFQKILKIYSFQPFSGPTPVPADRIPVILRITYELKRNDDSFISILYKANYNSPYSAHPTELVYTTNIDKSNGSRISLSNIVKINDKFAEDFKHWDVIPFQGENEELQNAVQDYVINMSEEDLLKGFETADIIGSGNHWGVYSYLSGEHLGISLGVPNYIGDHAEFEQEYDKLKEYLRLQSLH